MTASIERQVDALIGEKVMGWRVWLLDGEWYCNDPARAASGGHLPYYSTHIAAAWPIAEKLRLSVIQFSPTQWLAGQIYSEEAYGWTNFIDDVLAYGVVAETAPLAICRAALAAVQADVPTANPGVGR